jgi:DNA-binding winged helix-turn-helix (wHTH) protein
MQSAASQNGAVRFGVFEADLRSGELRRSGVKVKIQELPFRALKLLLSRPREVLSREEFRKALWPDGVFVDFDHGISSAINRLRDALGDSAENPVYIETVERRGYRWICPCEPAAVTPVVSKQELEKSVRTPVPGSIPPGQAQSAPPVSILDSPPRWRFILVLPVVILLFVVWLYWSGHRSARAGRAIPPAPVPSSAADADFSHRPANREAEDYYLKGRFYWNKRTPESLNQAVDAFTQAIVHDPN